MRLRRFLCFALTGLVVAGCLSGQTGSPDCVDPQTCACAVLGQPSLLRATVVEFDATRAVVDVDEVLSQQAYAGPVAVGARLRGTRYENWACNQGQLPKDRFEPGDPVFVGFFPDGSSAECAGDTCGTMTVRPWTDPITFSPGETVAVSAISALADYTTCRERFPPPDVPCSDVVTNTCAAAPLSKDTTGSAPVPLLAVAVAVGCLRRSRKRRERSVHG